MVDPGITVEEQGGQVIVRLAGDVVLARVAGLRRRLASMPGGRSVALDLSGVGVMDTAGAWLVVTMAERLQAEGTSVEITGATEAQRILIDTVRASLPRETAAAATRPGGLRGWLERVGADVADSVGLLAGMTSFFGRVMAALAGTVVRPWRLRLTALVHHMQDAGLNAVPIVALMAFLIGVVLAFQGAAQLRQFGAEVFVVDLITISVLRELGILLTAIIVAGRTASAYTAAIGSMKMREEIDAMRTLGLDPIEVLVLPRVVALVIMLPALGFIANIAGLTGGALMSWIELGISPGLFVARLIENANVWHFLVGMIKAPFFALIIGIVGCYEGMQVEKSAESLGRLTSKSVVVAIFVVIVVNALFSIFFVQVGV
jgi:phospholipid/cholesterol/gamma-HCH transport system permease protein